VAGTTGTLEALEAGKAKELLLTYEFREVGYWCTSCGRSFRGEAKPCACGGETVEVDLRERCIALAVGQGIEVEFVRHSPELARVGGIGGFLRG
jgi:peptide subunit release factor 1 (eRF1)